MQVGLKVEAEYDTRDAYLHLLGGGNVPSRLAAIGIEAVEMPLHRGTDFSIVAEATRRFSTAGLQASYHPYTEGTDVNPAHFGGPDSATAAAHERFFSAAARSNGNGGHVVVNIHPAAAGAARSRSELLERSVEFFAWARDWCSQHTPGVVPVAELQVAPLDGEAIIRIGDTPEELATVVTRSDVPACWDVGHAVWNHRRFGSRLEPTDELWNRIAHVHCHDVGGVDHRVLRRGDDAPWRDFLVQLSGRGFSGTVIIEVAARTFLEAGGVEALEESVAAVRQALGRRAGG